MINCKVISFFFILFLFHAKVLTAQFINLQIQVESEISTTVEQDLDFGSLVSNVGEQTIELGDVRMGIFSIRAYHTQTIFVQLNTPEFLSHPNPAVSENIPLYLNVAYNNSGVNDSNRSIPLQGNSGYIEMSPSTTTRTNDIWKIFYLYIYGYIDIGNIPNGEYSGSVQLVVAYD